MTLVKGAHVVNEIAINAQINYRCLTVGVEQTPVIIADDLLMDVQPLINYAYENNAFSEGQRTAYPGVRSPLPEPFTRELLEKLLPEIRAVYGLPPATKIHQYYGLFSLISTAEQDLKVLQRVPHCDSRDPHYFAIMCYLNPAPHGGTGFYRHNPSGYERINDDRFGHYVQTAEAYLAAHGLPEARYYRAEDGHFSIIGQVDYQPNRLLVYPGNLLHSGLINPQRDICADPKQGRLTANIFVALD